MGRTKDVLWEYIIPIDDQKVKCTFCHKTISGGITRMRYHFAKLPNNDVEPCPKVSAEVEQIASDGVRLLEQNKTKKQKVTADSCDLMASSSTQITQPDVKIEPTDQMLQEKKKTEARKALVRWAFSQDIPLDCFRSPHFLEAYELVADNGPGCEPLSSDLGSKKLISELNREAVSYVESVKQSCKIYGCTLIIDRWKFKSMHYITVMAVCLKDAILLDSMRSTEYWSSNRLYRLVSDIIRHLGSENVVQVLEHYDYGLSRSDIARVDSSTYVPVSRIYKSTFGDVVKSIQRTEFFREINETATKIVKLLESNSTYHYLSKIHTDDHEFEQNRNESIYVQRCLELKLASRNDYEFRRNPNKSKYLQRFLELKLALKDEEALRRMFALEETSTARDSKVTKVKRLVEETGFWERGKKAMIAIESLLKISMMVDGHTSTLGYIYHAYLKARDATQVCAREMGDDSLNLWPAYDKMVQRMDRSIYKMGAYLNPHLFYDNEVKLDNERDIPALVNGIDKMVPASGERDKLLKELQGYCALDKSIFQETAIETLHQCHPRLWWEAWGGAVPTLQSVAIKILSQPYSIKVSQDLRNIIQAVHEKENGPMEFRELRLLRVHCHLMETASRKNKAAADHSGPILLDEIEDFDNAALPLEDSTDEEDEVIRPQARKEEEKKKEEKKEDHIKAHYVVRESRPYGTRGNTEMVLMGIIVLLLGIMVLLLSLLFLHQVIPKQG